MNFSKAIAGSNAKPFGGIDDFDKTEAAPEFVPLPSNTYYARVLKGEDCTTRAGDEAYQLRFEVTEGEHAGKTVTRKWTFGAKALPYTKRDLSPFGLTSAARLRLPFPEAGRDYHVRLVVVLLRDDDGIERNDIKRIDQLRAVDSPVVDFALDEPTEGGSK